MARKTKNKSEVHHWCCCYGNGRVFWGVLILLVGLWLLARDLGWINFDVSFWAVVLIFVGVWMLIRRGKKVC